MVWDVQSNAQGGESGAERGPRSTAAPLFVALAQELRFDGAGAKLSITHPLDVWQVTKVHWTRSKGNGMSNTPTPVVFIHGLWLHATSWGPWLEHFRAAGYAPVAPGWPGEPDTVAAARAHPEAVADIGIDDAAAHFAAIIEELPASPIIIGHSFGGLLTEKLMGRNLGIAGVAIDPAQIKGVLPLPLAQLRSGLPALGNPTNLHKAVSLTEKQFRYGFGNAVSEQESAELFEK